MVLCWNTFGTNQHYNTHDSPSKTKLKRLTIQLVAFKLPYLRIEAFCELEQVLLLKSP